MATLLELLVWIGVIIVAFICAIIAIVLWIRSFDYKIRIRELTSNKVRLIMDTTAKKIIDKENVEYLKLFTRKGIHKTIPVPPEGVIDYDPKSKKRVVECWFSDNTGYVWVKDNKPIEGLQPVTTNQRLMYVNQLKKKAARKKVPWTDYLPFITSGVVLVAVLVILLIFWDGAVQPTIEVADKYEQLLQKTDAILEKAIIAEGGSQIVGGETIPP